MTPLTNSKHSALQLISNYKKLLKSEKLSPGVIEEKQYNYEFVVSDNSNKVKVLVYFGKKGNKTVIQGNNETEFYGKVNSLIFGETLFSDETSGNNSNISERTNFSEPSRYIGTDEVGKGDYFGPLIIAGVLVDDAIKRKLLEIGVKDSKELTDVIIQRIAPKIKKLIKDNYDIIIINPVKYNELYAKMRNINRILAWGHAKVLENILQKNSLAASGSIDEAVSDKFGDEKLILNSLQKYGKKIKLYQTHKAEKYVAVASASILARDKLVDWFEKNSKKLEFSIPKGSSFATIEAARKIRSKFGEAELKNYVKLHFKSTRKVMEK